MRAQAPIEQVEVGEQLCARRVAVVGEAGRDAGEEAANGSGSPDRPPAGASSGASPAISADMPHISCSAASSSA